MPRRLFNVVVPVFLLSSVAFAQPQTRPVPQLQTIPQAHEQLSFQRDGAEIARVHFGPLQRRPYIFPVIGPSGRSVTRMGHPHDAQSHSHHNSVWISHQSVNGISFWDDKGKGKIVHVRIDEIEDDPKTNTSWIITRNAWTDESASKVLLNERRRITVQLLEARQQWIFVDVQLSPAGKEPVTLAKTPFGLIGVRMAKTIGVNDGGGEIRNSEGASGEKAIFWKPAKWVDYSGPITNDAVEGITLMDHPSNVNHPSGFHVRADGWMGSSLTLNGDLVLEPGKLLTLRYGLFVHAGKPAPEAINQRFEEFAKMTPLEPPVKK